ncbi:Penicillin-binding protein 2 [Candidatus Westeberhardia cardiocondylae]|uniref:Penicillin-binding protein 2 n=1 Tax=Candidatus Westeberhardia cardiocondylae TaxID=1594731 RepID=A0A0H5C5E0_9ENTR|nr:penicillin-binding protein 2 [Candidatus Westeberhardia cardiocondylae]MCR3756349.1 peptidoglycan DD-transpeptidase MrdA [Candidatus Westeberhardia cardiocondylae]CEN32166.1 Penicillin-binding protein 2 [Candidatus Westeberhardia cardiocondylae]
MKMFLFKKRILLVSYVIIFFIGVLIVNLYYLQIFSFKEYQIRSNKNRIKFIPIIPKRGIIYDCHGIPLALNYTSYQLEIMPNKIKNLKKTINSLQNIVHLSNNDIMKFKNLWKREKYRFLSFPIKCNLTNSQLASFFVNQNRFPGVYVKSYQCRYYPYGSILAHVLGYVSKNDDCNINQFHDKNKIKNYAKIKNVGKLGIERFYNQVLYGVPGYIIIEVDRIGNMVRKLHECSPISGKNIILSLDIFLQIYITKLLNNIRSAVVVADPRNGEIRALLSSPSYNPNLFTKSISTVDYFALSKNENFPFINRVTQGLYPPASTVKPQILVSALTHGIIKENFFMYDPGWWKFPGSKKYYRDWKRWGHGLFNLTIAIEESIDTLFYQLAYDMGIDLLSEYMKKFGYGKLTGIDIKEEYSGIMPNKEWKLKKIKQPWYPGDTISIGIGQGYWIATPIQMLKALMILINNGNIYTPHLCVYISDLKNKMLSYQKKYFKVEGLFSSKYWHVVKEGMYAAANCINGTAYKSFSNAKYKVAAKSGTAQVYSLRDNEIYDINRVSEKLRDHKLMVSFAPFDTPTICIVIVLENSNMNTMIGIITRKIFDYILLNDCYIK